ncbi:TPA: PBSX family phage terminase large subunit [Klebsiella variicola]
MSSSVQLPIPAKLAPLFTAANKRYRCSHGGRGSAKTRTFALMTAVKAYQAMMNGDSGVILCAREFMNSLEESSMEEVKQAIRSVPWLAANFDIGEKYIRTIDKSVSYVFCGLRHNLDSIKSKARILLCWVDEAESVSEIAWQKLSPTVREDGSEIWVTWNPERDGSPTDKRFRKEAGDDCITVEMNYQDNPWFPDVLEGERQSDRRRLDDQTYAWIWDGAYRENSDAQILAGKYRIEEFDAAEGWDGPYYGIDWGFSQDPTAGVKCWVFDRKLWIEYEAGKVGLENDDIASFMIQRIPGIEEHVVRADSARPETISHVKNTGNGLRKSLPRITGVEKWKGSVEDGIAHLRSYQEIIIHPRCTGWINEARMYSYKVDRLTGDVLTDIVDAFNHYIDATRYALSPMIKRKGQINMNPNLVRQASSRNHFPRR